LAGGMDARVARDGLREYAPGDIQITIPYVVYRQVQLYLQAIDSRQRPEQLIVDIIRGYLRKLNL